MAYVSLIHGVYLTNQVAGEICTKLGYNSEDEEHKEDGMHNFFNEKNGNSLTLTPYFHDGYNHKGHGYILGYALHQGECKNYDCNQVLSVPQSDIKTIFDFQKDFDSLGLNINQFTIDLIVVSRLY